MKLATAVLIFSFFVPALCEINSSLSAPAHTCSQHQSQQENPKEKAACCLLATLDRPVIREIGHNDGAAGIIAATLEPIFILAVEPAEHYVFDRRPIDHSGPPRLWVH